jgi:hypothetical protein
MVEVRVSLESYDQAGCAGTLLDTDAATVLAGDTSAWSDSMP